MKMFMKAIAASAALFGLAPSCGSASPIVRNTFHELSPMNSSRAAHTLTTLNNGMVLVVGGFTAAENQIASAELFDVEGQRFHVTGNSIVPRQSHTATLLPNGQVLITGGFNAQGRYLDTAEVFDPAAQRFSSAGRMKVPRAGHTAVVLDDGRVVLIGGATTDWIILDSMEIYDPNTRVFSEAGRMIAPRASTVSVLLRDGRIFIAGGHTGRGATLKRYNTSEIFDPRSGRSIPSADMALPRDKHDGVLLADGRVLITGGSDGHVTRSDRAEIFDPQRNAFTSAATMKKARFKHRGSSLLLRDGKVLIAGGSVQPEIYDPASGTFTLINTKSQLTGHFSAVALLRDHRVLIAGGYFRADATSRGAWMYEP